MSMHERPAMTIDEAIRRRRSVRGFLPDEVPEATLREVFELAQWSPSNCNVQPWTPHVVSGEALKRLREALVAAGMRDEPIKPDWPADGKFTGVYRERQVDAAQQLYGAMGVARSDVVGRKMAYIRNHAFFDAPHAVLIFMPAPFDTREAADIGMYAQTLMLALTARGIASCAQGALGLFPEIIREQLGIPQNYKLLFGVSFGYEDRNVKANAARVGRAAYRCSRPVPSLRRGDFIVTGPLNGFRVVEMGGIGPAPFAGALLGDLGADVLRIDRIAKPGVEPDLPPRFDFYNRNKRSVAFDLKQPQAVAAVLDLVGEGGRLIEGFRPSVMERLGLGPDVCHGINPRLVYARMTGWGQQGPMAQEAGHDINYLALTGALHCLGDADRPPPPPLNLVADLGGGALYLVVGLLAASMEARQSGRGQTIDVAMIDGVTHLMSAFQAFRQQGSWTGRRADNIVDGGAPFYGSYATSDGKFVAVGAIEPQFYASLLKVMGIDGERLPDQNDRTAWPQMRKRFAKVFATRHARRMGRDSGGARRLSRTRLDDRRSARPSADADP